MLGEWPMYVKKQFIAMHVRGVPSVCAHESFSKGHISSVVTTPDSFTKD